MIDLTWHKFNKYLFEEKSHTYHYYDKVVKFSVTQFIHKYFEDFDTEAIATKYALKHNLQKDDVIKDWDINSKIASCTGTIIHKYLEDLKRGKQFEIDYSEAIQLNLLDEVRDRVSILLPKATKFHQDTLDKLFPLQLEFTVGIEDYIAGNIDMLCYNQKADEIQIWDYKNCKEIKTSNIFRKCLPPFNAYDDCNFIKYSIQQSMYKAIIYYVLGIKIGKCYLVHFDYTKLNDEFDIYECYDFTEICLSELQKLVDKSK